MQIKDVEKLTGLTQKSIRYYEEKNLLTVKRNEENDYRDYSEENVERLRCIKLLRYLGFSVQEMRSLFENMEGNWKDCLEKKTKELQEENEIVDRKKDLCKALMKDGYKKEVIDEYSSVVEFLEGDDFTELKTSFLSFACRSLSSVILTSFILIAPILWMFIYIGEGRMEELSFVSVVAVISTVLLTLNWVNYFMNRNKYKEMQKEKNSSNKFVLVKVVACIVISLAVFVLLTTAQEKVLAPKGWLFYCMRPWAELLLIVCLVILVLNVLFFITKKGKKEKVTDEMPVFYGSFQKYPILVSAFLLCVIAFCLFNTTFVTSNSIVDYSIKHPLGKTYAYSDIQRVEAKFGTKRFSFLEYKRKGNFSYTIYLEGEKRVFAVPSVNGEIERYYNDTYLELEEFDQKLMELGIKKISDDTNWKNCDLDKQYVDRFRRIIANE